MFVGITAVLQNNAAFHLPSFATAFVIVSTPRTNQAAVVQLETSNVQTETAKLFRSSAMEKPTVKQKTTKNSAI